MTDNRLRFIASPRRLAHVPTRLCRMLRGCNIAALATWSILIMSCCITAAAPAATGPQLDADLATQAYVVIENWVGRAAVPAESLPIRAADACGVFVTLRFQGLTIGNGTAMLDDPLSPLAASEPTDIMALARRAVQAALDDAQSNLIQLATNRRAGAMPTQLAALAPLLQLDLQIARVPQRLALNSIAELPGRVTLDAQGLALRDRNGGKWSIQFPGQAVAANLSLQAQLNRLLTGLNLNIEQFPTIGSAKGPELFRFDIVQIVRMRSDEQPLSLYRGQVVLNGSPTLPAIAGWSGQWADQLIGRMDNEGHFAGTFEPTYSRFDPAQAPAADAALACYALAAFSRATPSADVRDRAAAAAQRGLERLLADLGASASTTQADQSLIPHTQDVAMTLLALLELPGNSRYKAQRDRLAEWLIAAFTPDKGFRGSPNIQSPAASAPASAAAALALIRLYDQTRDEHLLEIARQVLSMLWTDAAKRHTDVTMPWAALAEFELAKLGKPTPGLLMTQNALRSIWRDQVTADPNQSQPPSPDVIGGFRATSQLFDEPTWLSAGPLIAMADAMTVEHFIDDADKPAWMVNVAMGLRFCAQLTLTRQSTYYVQNWKQAVGAVRNSNYDNRQPTAATAYALLAASEFQKSLAVMARSTGHK